MLKNDIRCPFCNSNETESTKTWKYGNTIVSRHECSYGKNFNFYQSSKSSWTIPKKQK